jgi:hypothetical protein
MLRKVEDQRVTRQAEHYRQSGGHAESILPIAPGRADRRDIHIVRFLQRRLRAFATAASDILTLGSFFSAKSTAELSEICAEAPAADAVSTIHAIAPSRSSPHPVPQSLSLAHTAAARLLSPSRCTDLYPDANC